MFIRSHRSNRRPTVAPASVQVEAPVEEKISVQEIEVAEEAKKEIKEEIPDIPVSEETPEIKKVGGKRKKRG